MRSWELKVRIGDVQIRVIVNFVCLTARKVSNSWHQRGKLLVTTV